MPYHLATPHRFRLSIVASAARFVASAQKILSDRPRQVQPPPVSVLIREAMAIALINPPSNQANHRYRGGTSIIVAADSRM
jgi:hypothetical protein